VTDTINRTGLVSHPTPSVMANHAEDVAKRVRKDGHQVIRRATVLAARGLPNNTAGSGSRGSDSTSPTERAVGLSGDDGNATPPDAEWHDVDADLARLHRNWWALGTQILAMYDRIQSHASDNDVIPAGAGPCACGCSKTCDPRKDPEDRLKSTLHPTCYRRYHRWRSTNPNTRLSDFIDASYLERGETRAQPVAGPRTNDEDAA